VTGAAERAAPGALAQRLADVAPSATMAVAAEADRLRRAGEDVVDLSAGEPDFPTPSHVKAAAVAALDADFTRYTVSRGILELRAAIARQYQDAYGVTITPEEVLVTAGGKQGLFNAALALFDPGDEVITHAPYWPTIPEQVRLAGATPVIVPMPAEDGFAVDAAALVAAVTPRTKAIIVTSPANPTGALLSEAGATLIAQAARDRGLWVIADLCYEQLIYDDVPHNLPAALFAVNRDRTVLSGSASKTYARAGWRCGWTIAPAPVTAAMNTLQGQATSHVTSITQKAALAAIDGPQDAVDTMRQAYRERRDRMVEWLNAIPGVTCARPAGAFYLFPSVAGLLTSAVPTSAALAGELLARERVVVTPGEAFGTPGHVRISCATSLDTLREGAVRVARLADVLMNDR
jgi:aspartate aminotransferase